MPGADRPLWGAPQESQRATGRVGIVAAGSLSAPLEPLRPHTRSSTARADGASPQAPCRVCGTGGAGQGSDAEGAVSLTRHHPLGLPPPPPPSQSTPSTSTQGFGDGKAAPPAARGRVQQPRSRLAGPARASLPTSPPRTFPHGIAVSLQVRWHTEGGPPGCGSRVHALRLTPIPSVSALKGVSRRLLDRAYTDPPPPPPPGEHGEGSASSTPSPAYPPHLASTDYHFTPAQEFLTLPGDVSRTEFRLIVGHRGWEYTVLRRDMHAGGEAAGSAAAVEVGEAAAPLPPPCPPGAPPRRPAAKLLVTAVEFESTAFMAGGLGVRLALVAYPVITVSRTFLDACAARLLGGDGLVGLLTS